MARGNFQKCHAITAAWEGGWSNHPADPGGKTMYGITEATYHAWLKRNKLPLKPVKNISRAQAELIYFDEYWRPAKAEDLAPGVDLATYDAAVNSGVSRARTWLLASIGGADAQTVKNICKKRLGFMQSLKIWKTFGKGWARRVADIEAKGVAMATTAAANQNVAKLAVEREAAAARSTSAKQAGGTGAVGVGSALAGPEATDQLAAGSLLVVIAIVAVIAGVLIWRANVNRVRAEAYEAEARKL